MVKPAPLDAKAFRTVWSAVTKSKKVEDPCEILREHPYASLLARNVDSLSKCIPGWQDFKFVAIFVPPVFGKRTLHIETSEDNLQRGFYRLLRIQGQPDFERVRAQIQPRCNVCGIELAGEQWEINRCHLRKVRGRGEMPEKSDEGR